MYLKVKDGSELDRSQAYFDLTAGDAIGYNGHEVSLYDSRVIISDLLFLLGERENTFENVNSDTIRQRIHRIRMKLEPIGLVPPLIEIQRNDQNIPSLRTELTIHIFKYLNE